MSTKRTPPQAWFRNPTEEAVIRKITLEEYRKRHPLTICPPPKVYICSPFAGDTEGNVAKALKYCRFALNEGKFPIAPHCYLPRFMDDNDRKERELAISFGIRLLDDCTELWAFGDRISDGMSREIDYAIDHKITIRRFTENMEEVQI
jgi:hypothetical protein